MRGFSALIAAIVCFALAHPLIADEPTPRPISERDEPHATQPYKPDWPEPPNVGSVVVKLFVGVVAAGLVGVVLVWTSKRRLRDGKHQNATHLLTTKASLALGNRAVLHLVQSGDYQLIAATDASGVKSLLLLPDEFPLTDRLDSQERVPGNTDGQRA